MPEPRIWLIYWDSGSLRVKGDELRQGEFGPGVHAVEPEPVADLLERVCDALESTEGIGAQDPIQDAADIAVLREGRSLLTALRGANASGSDA